MIRRVFSNLDTHDRVGAVCGAIIFVCVIVLAYGYVQERDELACASCKTAVAMKE